jgi:hypothetical protein
MKFSQFLILFAVNLLTIALPTGLAVYVGVRAGLRSRKVGEK